MYGAEGVVTSDWEAGDGVQALQLRGLMHDSVPPHRQESLPSLDKSGRHPLLVFEEFLSFSASLSERRREVGEESLLEQPCLLLIFQMCSSTYYLAGCLGRCSLGGECAQLVSLGVTLLSVGNAALVELP